MATPPHDEQPTLSEGDVNVSPRRAAWIAGHVDGATRRILDEDEAFRILDASIAAVGS